MSRRSLSGNKGIFFSLFAVVLLVLIAIQFVGQQKFQIESEQEALQTQFEVTNTLVKDIEATILPQLLEADVGVALNAIARDIAESGRFVADQRTLMALVNDSVLNGSSQTIRLYVKNATLPAQLPILQDFVNRQFHVALDVTPRQVVIWQDDATGPGYVGATLTAHMFVNAGFAVWERELDNITAFVPIDGLIDPHFLYHAPHSSGQISFTGRSALYTPSFFQRLVADRTYFTDANAPSYLQRFTHDTAPSTNGIETIISLNNNVVPQDSVLRRRVMVDWCYWEERFRRPGCDVPFSTLSGLTKSIYTEPFYGFTLDSAHVTKYSLTPLEICDCAGPLNNRAFAGSGCIKGAGDTRAVDERC